MRRISADIIFPVTSAPLADHVLLIDNDGTIIGIEASQNFENSTIEKFNGALAPGFINTHCHLELSHLKGKFHERSGLPSFLMQVLSQREAQQEEIINAMELAEQEMIGNGIVAVGDISNNSISFSRKSKKNIYYHTFIELIAFNPYNAFHAIELGEKVLSDARGFGIHASFAPHAPYSVSPELIKLIGDSCFENGKPTCIHMLESNDENEFYIRGTGLYRNLYREINVDIKFFTPTGKSSLESLLPYFNKNVRTLMVHNTIATPWEIEWAEDMHPQLFWCFCPNANLFIEDRVPDIPLLMEHAQYFTIGTDSLASNHGLSVLEEIKTIQRNFPGIHTDDLLRWSTLYGAKFLGIDDQFGSFDAGKKPGVNLISGLTELNGELKDCSVRKII